VKKQTHHLGNAEAVPKVVEGHLVVVLVDLVEPFAERVHRDAELLDEAQLDEHGLHEVDDVGVAPLVGVEGRQAQGGPHLLREGRITNFQEAALHLLMLW